MQDDLVMAWAAPLVIAVAGIASMRAAFERGDLDEAARQGVLAGPGIVETALAAGDRATQLAAIAAAPSTTDAPELLDALAVTAAGPDRRTAIPAARAARTIAIELAQADLPDDIAPEDVAAWRARWVVLAQRADRWIEVRVLALDIAAALDLDRTAGSSDLATAMKDPDPDFRRAAAGAVPTPVPPAMRGILATAVTTDTSDAVALVAAQVVCFELEGGPAKPILDAVGTAGLQRIRTLVGTAADPSAIRDAARCLAADRSPASAAALRTIKKRPQL